MGEEKLTMNDWREIMVAKDNSQQALDRVKDLEIKVHELNQPSNQVLELKIDTLAKAIMGNGKKGVLDRLRDIENRYWYLAGGIGLLGFILMLTH